MTNKEAIEELESLIEHCYSFLDHKHHEPWESDIEALKLGIEALKERPQGEWIPISERLPEALQIVLVTSKGGYVYTSCIAHGDWEYGGEVIAWRPLPEPYKKGVKNDT